MSDIYLYIEREKNNNQRETIVINNLHAHLFIRKFALGQKKIPFINCCLPPRQLQLFCLLKILNNNNRQRTYLEKLLCSFRSVVWFHDAEWQNHMFDNRWPRCLPPGAGELCVRVSVCLSLRQIRIHQIDINMCHESIIRPVWNVDTSSWWYWWWLLSVSELLFNSSPGMCMALIWCLFMLHAAACRSYCSGFAV